MGCLKKAVTDMAADVAVNTDHIQQWAANLERSLLALDMSRKQRDDASLLHGSSRELSLVPIYTQIDR